MIWLERAGYFLFFTFLDLSPKLLPNIYLASYCIFNTCTSYSFCIVFRKICFLSSMFLLIIPATTSRFLVNAFDFICCRGMDQEGLFRREGNASRLNQNNWVCANLSCHHPTFIPYLPIVQAVYLGSAPIPANFSVHDVCSMVKRFFRDLKEPLLAGASLRNRLFEMVNKNQISPVRQCLEEVVCDLQGFNYSILGVQTRFRSCI